jgi:hypothetical protein
MKLKAVIFWTLAPFVVFAQKFDNIWIIGDSNIPNTTAHGGMILNFAHTPAKVSFHYRPVNMFVANSSMCDSSGSLLFYTNGCEIASDNDEVLPNGDDINPGPWHTILCDQNNDGYATGYPGLLTLPQPDSGGIYYVVHQTMKYVPSPMEYAFVAKLHYTKVRKTEDPTNEYIVGKKNILLVEDSLSAGELNAVKHGNGKDWWVIQPRRNSNQFYIFLLTKNGISFDHIQTIGSHPPAEKENLGQTIFSPDGTIMVRFFAENPIMYYQFNRNTGFFEEFRIINIDFGADLALDGGCAISPSSQFLYISALLQVYQFDLWASEISTSQVKVAMWDGFVDPVAIAFLTCQLGPDCKIYILGGGDTKYYHIIHNPDEPGLACNVEQRGLVLPTPSGASIPYFPNYRLGPIDNPGLPCSPVVAMNHPPLPLPEVHVWPNPAHDQLGFSLVENSIKSISLRDALGRVVKTVSLGSSSGTYTMSVSDLAGGLYFWEIEDVKGRSLAGKVIIQ